MKIPLSNPLIGQPERDWVDKCIDSGFVSSVGPLVSEFEAAFAGATGTKHSTATVSGTAAIHAVLTALGTGPGDAVVVSDLTFVASANPVLYCGAEPVFCDVHPDTWCMDPRVLEGICRSFKSTGRRISAIIPVHVYGCACDMPAIMDIAGKYGIPVIEDATEALGTTLNGKQVGSFGKAGCFSFNGNKMITSGGGGMIVSAEKNFIASCKHLVNQARADDDHYVHDVMGFNYRMTNLTASLGLAQLDRFKKVLARKRSFAAEYAKALAKFPEVQLHPEPEGVCNCFWLYSAILKEKHDREKWIASLKQRGIPARRFFHPLHQQPYMKRSLWTLKDDKVVEAETGISDTLAARGINLPSSPDMTEDQLRYVVDALSTLARSVVFER